MTIKQLKTQIAGKITDEELTIVLNYLDGDGKITYEEKEGKIHM